MEILFYIGITIFIFSLIGIMWTNVSNNYSAPTWFDNVVIFGVIVGGVTSAISLIFIAGENNSNDKYYITNKEIIITDTIYSSGDTLYIYQLENSKIKDKKLID